MDQLPNTTLPRELQLNFDALKKAIDALTTEVDALQLKRTVEGITTSAGGITAGTGFTVTRNGVGDYTITFNPVFGAVPAVTAIPREGDLAATVRHHSAATASAVRLKTLTTAGALSDSGFHFIARGSV